MNELRAFGTKAIGYGGFAALTAAESVRAP
jgi:hypothetical protein